MIEPEAPRPIVPVPASEFSRLRGRRVIVGVPGIGFRGDLRADDPVVQGGRTHVPILSELDYYRAEMQQIEAFAPLVPIDRVWVEEVASGDTPVTPRGASLDVPPVSEPTPVLRASSLVGRRVVQQVPDGFVRDLRAVTPVYIDERGVASVRVCGEADWYLWGTTGAVPSSTPVNATLLWTE